MIKAKDIIQHDTNELPVGFKVKLDREDYFTPSLNSEVKEISHWIYSGKHKVVEVKTENGKIAQVYWIKL